MAQQSNVEQEKVSGLSGSDSTEASMERAKLLKATFVGQIARKRRREHFGRREAKSSKRQTPTVKHMLETSGASDRFRGPKANLAADMEAKTTFGRSSAEAARRLCTSGRQDVIRYFFAFFLWFILLAVLVSLRDTLSTLASAIFLG